MGTVVTEKQRCHNVRVEAKKILKSLNSFVDEVPNSQIDEYLEILRAQLKISEDYRKQVAQARFKL